MGGRIKRGGVVQPLARGGIEYHYHAGQVAFMRLATHPAWDYGASVYGDEA